jgi:hypothetical protein
MWCKNNVELVQKLYLLGPQRMKGGDWISTMFIKLLLLDITILTLKYMKKEAGVIVSALGEKKLQTNQIF